MNTSNDLHQLSRKYWASATTSYLGTSAYYDAQEEALRKLLIAQSPFTSALDLGCADGRFTLLAAEYSRYTLGVDINAMLIQQARNRVPTELKDRIEFRVETIDEQPNLGTYELVMCLGVTSCLMRHDAFDNVVRLVCTCVRPGGVVVLKDTLSKKGAIVNHINQYVGMYRNREAYLAAWEAAGLRLLLDIPLSETEETTNKLMAFRFDQSRP